MKKNEKMSRLYTCILVLVIIFSPILLVKPKVSQSLAKTAKVSSVEKIPVRATIFSALSIVPYLIGFLGFALPNLDLSQVSMHWSLKQRFLSFLGVGSIIFPKTIEWDILESILATLVSPFPFQPRNNYSKAFRLEINYCWYKYFSVRYE